MDGNLTFSNLPTMKNDAFLGKKGQKHKFKVNGDSSAERTLSKEKRVKELQAFAETNRMQLVGMQSVLNWIQLSETLVCHFVSP